MADGGARNAAGAVEAQAAGAWALIGSVVWATGEKNLSHIAAGVAFYMLLSVFPGVAVAVALMGLFFDPSDAQPLLQTLRPFLPGEGYHLIEAQVSSTLASGGFTLGATALINFVVAFWSAGAAVRGMMSAMNLAFPDASSFGVFRFYGLSILFTAIAIALVIATALAIVLLPVAFEALRRLPIEDFLQISDATISRAELPVLLIIVATTLTLVYRIGAARGRWAWRAAFFGAVFATLAWIAASRLLAFYAASFGDFTLYGPLGALVGLMLWFWISALLVLVGAELARALQRNRQIRAGVA